MDFTPEQLSDSRSSRAATAANYNTILRAVRKLESTSFNEELKPFFLVTMGDAIFQAADDDASRFDGAKVFDHMSRSQQIASLVVVAGHLFHETPTCLPLTAWSEATLASVLHEGKLFVIEEVERERHASTARWYSTRSTSTNRSQKT